MKMKKMIMLAAIAPSLFTVAQADLLVNFPTNGNWVTASANGQGRTGGYVPFSMTSPRSPTNGASGYAGPVYYGGATGNVAISTWMIANSTPDYISSGGLSNGIGIGSRVSALVMFTNQSASITQVVWSIRQGGSGANQTNFVSIVVRKDDGSFYISDKMSNRNSIIATNGNLGGLAWYNYDPNTSLDARGSLVASFQLNNVTAVGEWQENIITVSGSPSVGISTFQAWGTVIPEPATVGMLGLGAAVTLLIRRMRAK